MILWYFAISPHVQSQQFLDVHIQAGMVTQFNLCNVLKYAAENMGGNLPRLGGVKIQPPVNKRKKAALGSRAALSQF